METKFDFEARKLIVGDTQISLDKLEDFILSHWYPLARAYRLRPIISGGKTLYTFDWSRIFGIAAEGGVIIMEFLEREGYLKRKTNNNAKPYKPLRQIGLFD